GHRMGKRALLIGMALVFAITAGVIWLGVHLHDKSLQVIGQLVPIPAFLPLVLLARPKTMRVRAAPDGLTVGDLHVPRSAIRGGSMTSQGGKRWLTFTGTNVQIEADEALGRRILEALALDAAHSVNTFGVASRVSAEIPILSNGQTVRIVGNLWFMPLFVAWQVGHWISGPVALAIFVVALALTAAAFAPSKLDVGADGITLRWLGTTRYVAFADVVSARERTVYGAHALDLELRSGKTLRILVQPIQKRNPAPGIFARVREAMALASGEPASSEAILLDQGTRSPREWLLELRALGMGAKASHRSAAVNPESLWRLVDDPKADAKARIAAAVVLGARKEPELGERLRIATASTADPTLKSAFDAAMREDDAALEEALATRDEA
ncbi:MAG TPA: hypothetical protein VF316_08045, partial [Polyangiaceae bacterium]